MAETASLSIRVTQEGADQAAASLRGLTQAGGGAEVSFGKLAMQIAGLNTGFGLAVQAGQKTLSVIKDLSVQSVQLAASFEKSRITWGVLVGDMEMGTKVFEQIRQFSAETPLSFEGLNQAATTIKGFGVATEDLIPTLSKLGDVAMGDNNKLQSLALVYGQVMAQGKAKTQDLYQFINAGVPIFNLLAESMNKSAGEIKELAAEGAVTFEEIEKAISRATSEGGQFYGMMDRVSESTSGKWSTALDNWKADLADLGERVLPMVNAALDKYNEAAAKRGAQRNIEKVFAGEGGDIDAAVKEATARLAAAEAGMKGLYGDMLQRQQNIVAQARAALVALQYMQLSSARVGDGDGKPYVPPVVASYLSPYGPYGSGNTRPYSWATQGQVTGQPERPYMTWGSANYEAGLPEAGPERPYMNQSNRVLPDPREIEASAEALRKFEASLVNIKDSMAQIGAEAFVDTFKNIGYDLASGALGADTFAESISNIAQTILNNMPLMLFQAGINAMATPGMFYVGLGLLAASGVVAIGGGAMNYAMEDNASGGVYNSRSLSAYSGGIYDKPQMFNFARGAAIGRFGEAGPEAIVPLQRMGNGKLGVASAGGGNVSVVVNNNAPNTTATATETTGADGTRQIAVIVKGLVKQGMASGEFDAPMARYGARPVGVRK